MRACFAALPDALSSATPRHLVIERYQKQNQDFELNPWRTHIRRL
jgi:hypothetical protein